MNNTNNTMETLNQAIIDLDFDLFENTLKVLNKNERSEIDKTHNFWEILSYRIFNYDMYHFKDGIIKIFGLIMDYCSLFVNNRYIGEYGGLSSSIEKRKDIVYFLHIVLKCRQNELFKELVDILAMILKVFNFNVTIFSNLISYQSYENKEYCSYRLYPIFENLKKLCHLIDIDNASKILFFYLKYSVHIELCVVEFLTDQYEKRPNLLPLYYSQRISPYETQNLNPLVEMLLNPYCVDSQEHYKIVAHLIKCLKKQSDFREHLTMPFCIAYGKNLPNIVKLFAKYKFYFVVEETEFDSASVSARCVKKSSCAEKIKNALLKFFKHK